MNLLSLIALFILMLANKVHSQDNTDFVFSSFDPNPTDLIYQGDTHVPCGSQNLRLTKTDSWSRPQTMSVGRVVYSKPIHLWEHNVSPKRDATIVTKIFLTHSVSSGDGFAFFIAPVGTTIPGGYCSNGGNLGIYNSSGSTTPVFAVEIDNFANPEWDPSYPHAGINVNSRISSKETRIATGVSSLTFFYNATAKSILFYFEGATDLHYSIDLSTILPEYVQVGISSATGADTSTLSIVEIDRWEFSARFEPTEQEMMNIHPQYDHCLIPEYAS